MTARQRRQDQQPMTAKRDEPTRRRAEGDKRANDATAMRDGKPRAARRVARRAGHAGDDVTAKCDGIHPASLFHLPRLPALPISSLPARASADFTVVFTI